MADPLSTATRATKRNLLIASVIAISANAFNVSIDRIPVGGLSITFDDRLFAFLLVIVLLYLLATFALYYAIDMKNLAPTEHQSAAESRYKERVEKYPAKYFYSVVEELRKHVPEGHRLTYETASISHFNRGTPQPIPYNILLDRTEPNMSPTQLKRESHADVFASIDQLQKDLLKTFAAARTHDRRRAKATLYATRSMYWIRNYFFDGALPIALGVVAVVALFAHWDLSWIQAYLPSFKELGTKHP